MDEQEMKRIYPHVFTVMVPVRVVVDHDGVDLRCLWRSVQWGATRQGISGSWAYKLQGEKLLWRDFKAAAEPVMSRK